MNILITGGAGFVGSSVARAFRHRYPDSRIVAFDNLRRHGSELNRTLFREEKIEFVHGDVRNASDFNSLNGDYELIIDASAEPSVTAGLNDSPDYVMHTNLTGTCNCLSFARERSSALIFLSTSRVYSIRSLHEIALDEGRTRFQLADRQDVPGLTRRGISEYFPTHLPRSLYGATKLASELLIQEFVEMYGLRAVVFRCGVIAGPGQFGKVDQGVFTTWVANHYFNLPLRYTGFGGSGKQVRDLLHPSDLFDLIVRALDALDTIKGQTFNVGGGMEASTSLLEFSDLCREVTGHSLAVQHSAETTAVDIPWYISDCSGVSETLKWRPRKSVQTIVSEIFDWIRTNERQVRPLFVR